VNPGDERPGRLAAVLFTPVPARLAFSSLGFHSAHAGLQPCERATLPESDEPRAVPSGRRLDEFDVVYASLAWEPEVVALVRSLRAARIEPVRGRRDVTQPLVVAGGPLTLSNPDLVVPFADAVFSGEADGAFAGIASALSHAPGRAAALETLASIPGMHVSAIHLDMAPPPPIQADRSLLPARSTLADEPNEFGDAFLVEVGRGCPRACAFCVARVGGRKPAFVPAERVLAAVPAGVRRVGLLGAAVSDHPHLAGIVEALVSRDVSVTLGSVRADRVTPDLLGHLVRGGLRTLTVAADGASEAVRARLGKDVTADDLVRCADTARAGGVSRLRLYAMLGLPGETDDDAIELASLIRRLSSRLRVAVSVSPFVPKRFTPLADAPFAGIRDLKRRIRVLAHAVGGAAALHVTSPREAEVEWRLSHARGGEAVSLVESLAG
jgi:radical SAM superfamily enzyme YgiQ (UPF0313 family)